jgi:hypothetical protein
MIAASVQPQFSHFPKNFFLQEFVQMDISKTENWHVRSSLDWRMKRASPQILEGRNRAMDRESRALAEGELAAKKRSSLRN